MRASPLILVTLATCLIALSSCGLRYVPEGATVCPDRVWMAPGAKVWLGEQLANKDGTATLGSLEFRVWFSQVILVMERLDICNGNDADRPSPYAQGEGLG